MNELSELLKERAASVHDDGAAERVAAVHHRVGVVRRRRASGVVAAALVAIAGVVGLNLHQEQPAVTPSGAPTTLVGRDVPRTVTTQEGTFRYVAGYTGADGSLAAELKATTTPRVLRVATEGESGTVSLGYSYLSSSRLKWSESANSRVAEIACGQRSNSRIISAGDFRCRSALGFSR